MTSNHNGSSHDTDFEHQHNVADETAEEGNGINKTVAVVAVVAVGAAVFEAALLPGLALGVAAVAAPKYLPKLAGALNPLFKSTVRGTYKFAQKSREMFAEAQEQVHDIVAEVKAEGQATDAKAADGRAHQPAA